MCKAKQSRLLVNVNDLRNFSMTAAIQYRGRVAHVSSHPPTCRLVQNPLEWLPPFEKALHDIAANLNDPEDEFDLSRHRLHIGFEGAFGELHVTPRSLSSKLLSHMVCLDGIVTSCSLIRPKLLRSVHWSEAGKTFLAKDYYDATMVLAGGSAALSSSSGSATSAYPTEDDQHRKLCSEFGLSTYRDYQTVTVQEMPERAPPGQLPRTVDVVLDDDLVDQVKPGDRARIVGIYRGMAGVVNGQVPNTFRAVLIANAIRPIGRIDAQGAAHKLSAAEEEALRIAVKGHPEGPLALLAQSVAPSIYGHDMIKRAVLLQQVGGVERNLDNGTHIRGDINIMMVGDPSTAKSQMLRYVLGISPLAVATTGRGSSGVGLTAAVTSDRETGERRLEAGAMVLADRGVVCIDEFDKMSDQDRVAIHEVMEQQTVTIAKAGIHTTLNARCSVLAAANPVFGRYRESVAPQDNIRLPDSLLSRFDLLFIVLDRCSPEIDRTIAEHVLRMHRYLPPGLAEGAVVPDKQSIYDCEEEQQDEESGRKSSDACISTDLIKKYILHAKQVKPVLTSSAIRVIVEAYCDFRQQREQSDLQAEQGTQPQRTFPVTARTLETLIRLATAHAKLRLDERVNEEDAQVAVDLVEFCLYKEVKRKPRKVVRRATKKDDDDDGDDDGDDEEEEGGAREMDKGKGKDKGKDIKVSQELQDLAINDPSSFATQPPSLSDYGLIGSSGTSQQPSTYPSVSSPSWELDAQVKDALNKIRANPQLGSLVTVDRLRQDLPDHISWHDTESVLRKMEEDNMIMYRDGVIIFI